MKILISAGESSGDLYAAALAEELTRRRAIDFFGCPGFRMRQAGVRAVIDQSKLSVVGLAEVVTHLPGIYREYRRLIEAARREKPQAAILTDSSGFHLRVAADLKRLGIPVIYLVAPQAWAWRRGRVKKLQRNVERLLCIFPFEEKFFRSYGVQATYIGHPLARLIGAKRTRDQFFDAHGLAQDRPLFALLPGSRRGEISRHLPILRNAIRHMTGQFVLGTPAGLDPQFIREALPGVTVARGESWDLLSHCDLAIAASGTVTVEAALLGAPMVTFYKVSALTWTIGRPLVKTPFFSMVNLIADRAIVPELIQHDATGERIASEAAALLADAARLEAMRTGLAEVRDTLRTAADPISLAADQVLEVVEGRS
jgi:lipid-A-disaccharide synthase